MITSAAQEKPTAVPVGMLFRSDADRYSIPLYQRNYTWGEEQIHRLVHDILDEAEQNETKDYFLGNLVVAPPAKEGDPFDVIDGQQRLTTLYILLTKVGATAGAPVATLQPLTYEAREKATRALRHLISGGSDTANEPSSSEDSGILQAATIIDQFLEDPDVGSRFLAPNVLDYLLHRVKVIRMPIDRETDLNRYFEIMNTRGAQLSPVDIVKARLLRHLTNPQDRAVLNHVWTACSDMEHYVAMTTTAGNTDLRRHVFGYDWGDVPSSDFSELRQRLIEEGPVAGEPSPRTHEPSESTAMTFDEALALYAKNDVVEETGDSLGDDRFTSQITFPTLLLHVLAVRDASRGDHHDDRQLDDKLLVDRFAEQMERIPATARADWVRAFTTDLLRVRFLFDRYVLKRDATLTTGHESTTDEEPGSWSLYRLTRADSRSRGGVRDAPRYSATFAADESDSGRASLHRRILLLQSALRVTYTSPRSMHWITDVLRYVVERADRGEEVTPQGLLDRLESYAQAQVQTAIRPGATAHGQQTSPDGLPLGFAIPRIVFTYLDYLLAEQSGDRDFTFSYRTSIEHFSPRQEDSEHASAPYHVDDDTLLDWLGNLALVTVSTNSKFSNYQPAHKAQNHAARRQSLKLDRMSRVAETGSWNDQDIRNHHQEMVELLQQALSRGESP